MKLSRILVQYICVYKIHVIFLIVIFGVSGLFYYFQYDISTKRSILTGEISHVRDLIAKRRSEIEIFALMESRESELQRLVGDPRVSANEALDNLGAHAAELGIIEVDFEAKPAIKLFEGDSHWIEQVELRLSVLAMHEGSILAWLNSLESAWSGQLYIERIELTRQTVQGDDQPVNGVGVLEGGIERVNADLFVQWLRLLPREVPLREG